MQYQTLSIVKVNTKKHRILFKQCHLFKKYVNAKVVVMEVSMKLDINLIILICKPKHVRVCYVMKLCNYCLNIKPLIAGNV